MFKRTKTYRPFLYPWAVQLTQEHDIDMHWHEKEVNLVQDVQQWNDGTMQESEKQFVMNVLRLFTQSDVAVGEVYKQCLVPQIQNNEISNMLTSFACREGVHQRAYALIPETLKFPDSEWHAFLDYTHMKQKWEFMQKNNLTPDLLFAKQVFMEGVSLFGSFAMLLHFKQKAKMLGMCEVVEWSIRDETVHVDANARLYRTLWEENQAAGVEFTDQAKRAVYQMARDVIEHEDHFIHEAFKLYQPEGLTESSVKQYVRYLADRRLIQMGFKGNWKVKDIPEELQWLQWTVNAPRVSNFFERRVTDYMDSGMVGSINWEIYE